MSSSSLRLSRDVIKTWLKFPYTVPPKHHFGARENTSRKPGVV